MESQKLPSSRDPVSILVLLIHVVVMTSIICRTTAFRSLAASTVSRKMYANLGHTIRHRSTMLKKHRIQWTNEEGTTEFEALDGELLRTAALRRGIVSPHNGKSTLINCRGLGTCGTCAVEITCESDAVAVEPKERNAKENLRLSFPPHDPSKQSPKLRLACQIQVRGDLEVTKRSGFWGQDKSLSPSSDCDTYFGDLEFLLDNKSPE